MNPKHQTYAMLKEHMVQAFELRLHMGTASRQNTAYNAYGANDDLMGTITKSLQNMQMANNTAASTINDNMSQITRETSELRAIIKQIK